MTTNEHVRQAAATAAIREVVDDTGYGSYVSDEMCRKLALAALEAADEVRREGSM